MKSVRQPGDVHAPQGYSGGVEPVQEQVLQEQALVQEQEQEQALQGQAQVQALQGRVVALGRRHSVVGVVLPC